MLMQSGMAALGAKAASMRPVRARSSLIVKAAGPLGDKWCGSASSPAAPCGRGVSTISEQRVNCLQRAQVLRML